MQDLISTLLVQANCNLLACYYQKHTAQVTKGSGALLRMMTPLVSLFNASTPDAMTNFLPVKAHNPNAGLLLNADSPHPNGDRKVKGPYFEFAKKKWETEDTFRCVQ